MLGRRPVATNTASAGDFEQFFTILGSVLSYSGHATVGVSRISERPAYLTMFHCCGFFKTYHDLFVHAAQRAGERFSWVTGARREEACENSRHNPPPPINHARRSSSMRMMWSLVATLGSRYRAREAARARPAANDNLAASAGCHRSARQCEADEARVLVEI